MFSYFVFLLIPLFGCQAYWQLDWADEFNGDYLDYTKWDVTNEEDSCDGNRIQQLNCKTNSSQNLWLLNGTLSIAAVQQKLYEKDYTSALITTKDSFTFGRFEIRAALPKGKFLRPAIYFIPTKNTGFWPTNGQFDMMTNVQTRNLGNGAHVVRGFAQYIGEEYTTPVGTQLNHFHTYVVEWNQTTILWKFDEKQHLTINLTEQLKNFDNPFIYPFKLVITLGIGGYAGGPFFNGILTEDDAYKWNCSLLIMDYVRVYKWIEGVESSSNRSEENQVTSSDICQRIMPLIRPAKEPNTSKEPNSTKEPNTSKETNTSIITTIISVFALILILVLFLLVIYLFKRQKRLKLSTRDSKPEIYEEPVPLDNLYECVKDYDNDYADPYQSPSAQNNYTNPLADSSLKGRPNYLSVTDFEEYSDTQMVPPVVTP